MKQPALLLFFLLGLGQLTNAQEPPSRHTLFGVKIGGTYTYMNFNKGFPPPPSPVLGSWKGGFTAGAMLNVRLTGKLSLQPEYSFLTASSSRSDSATTYHLSYLSLPVLLKYNLFAGLHLIGGAQFDLLINAKKEKTSTVSITHDTEERNVGVTGGLEYLFTSSLSLTMRYTHGLNHMGIGQRSAVQEYKNQQIILAAGIYF